MRKLIVGSVAALLGLALLAGPTAAKDGDVIKTGNCSGASDWKLKVGVEDGGRLDIEWEVDQNKVGQQWRAVVKHNGEVVYNRVRETKAPSGSFEVDKLVNNAAGEDHIVGKARNLDTDETCRGVINY